MSPQFTSLEDTAVRWAGQRKKKNHQLPTSTLNKTSLSTRVGRSTVCKYPTLLFATSNSVPLRLYRGPAKNNTGSHVGASPETRPSQCQSDGQIAEAHRHDTLLTPKASTSGAQVTPEHINFTAGKPRSSFTPCTSTPETTRLLTPPNIQTTEVPHCQHSAAPSVLSLLFPPNKPGTPQRTKNLLVRDTPESDYGLKVTWRRRKKLMRLLTERGQLPDTEAMVSNQWPEVV